MVATSKYWQFVSLTASGKRKIQEIVLAQDFFDRQFRDIDQKELHDSSIQPHLFELTRFKSEVACDQENGFLAEFCLRCYISHQIELVCLQLEQQFGRKHNFNRYELFPFVLDDTVDNLQIQAQTRKQSSYKPLAEQILETFDPQKATLSTWTTRLVKYNRELNSFLLQKGVYLVSDWAILNDTNSKQLKRILTEFHNLSAVEISQAETVLTSYHAVYRQERLQERRVGIKRKCQPPSEEQLTRIAILVQQKDNRQLSPKATLFQLQQLAKLLREYRIYVRGGGAIAQQSLDAPETNADRLQLSTSEPASDESEQTEFLQAYRQQFQECLDAAIATVVQFKYERLAKKKRPKGQEFLTALDLFHCQGKSMTEIAPAVNLTAQFQVTRLLKLKELRADIRQKLLQQLRDRLLTLAAQYQTRTQLQQLETKLEEALAERIDAVMQESEVAIARNSHCESLFARQLCRYLDSRQAR